MLTEFDARATAWINGLSGYPPFDSFFTLITNIGVPLLVIAVALSWWLPDNPQGKRRAERHAAICCGLSFLLGLALNQAILLLVQRARPYDAGITHLLIAPSVDPSFPSDHATASFAIVFSYLLQDRFRRTMLFLLGALCVVFSRIYVGTHYLSDIAGGMATALIAAIVIRAAYWEGTRLDRWVTALL
ncbi:MAG TPA: phosphatase PAP2 family protein [Terriglobales bacterium]|nr:phosphatase PAP2 family protein [Terriglobales bacterium]